MSEQGEGVVQSPEQRPGLTRSSAPLPSPMSTKHGRKEYATFGPHQPTASFLAGSTQPAASSLLPASPRLVLAISPIRWPLASL